MTKKESRIIDDYKDFLSSKFDNVEVEQIPAGRDNGVKTPDLKIRADGELFLVEIKSLHDRQEVEHSERWASAVARLHKQIDRNPKKSQLTGSYIIDTPSDFSLPTNNDPSERLADFLLDTLLSIQDDSVKNVEFEGFHFSCQLFSNEGDPYVSFADSSRGGSFNAAGTVHENISSSILKAAKQLQYLPPEGQPAKKIILISNEYIFGNRKSVIEGLAYSFENLRIIDVDEVWLQTDSYSDDEVRHELILTRQFMDGFFGGELEDNPETISLFELWYFPLSQLPDELGYKNLMFRIMKDLFSIHKPHEIISNQSYTREEMIRLGEWLTDQERYDDAVWFVEQFIDDPSPSADSDDIKDPNSIRTVLGRLAWVIQQLTVKEEYIAQAFEFSKVLANHPNPYVKLQSLIPLIEIAKRRKWLEKIDSENGSDLREQLQQLAFNILREFKSQKALADWLAHLFSVLRDLNTQEAREVLESLKDSRDAAALYVYFGIFRKYHFKDENGEYKVPFDSTVLEGLLNEAIHNFEDNPELTNGIAWQITKIVRDTPDQFDKVEPWIDQLLSLPYQSYIEKDLERILPKVFEIKPEVAVRWSEQLISAIHDHIVAKGNNDKGQYWFNLDQVVALLARHNPQNFLEIFKKVIDIWKNWAFIGSNEKFLTVYTLIEEPQIREAIKQLAKQAYTEQKEAWPNLEEFAWPD